MTHEFESLRPALAYLSADEVGQIEQAYEFSRSAHEGQFRKSGEPYISHPLAVAGILAGWHLDAQTLCAALLHDVVEDTPATAGEIEARFGKPVALLVEGVSKLDKLA
ncbi:MAG: HD domain-containing protein, partial [Rhodospirillaceae bacterium]|nr:HD domain-containing protein [Rhodospirillaceae bacterium]